MRSYSSRTSSLAHVWPAGGGCAEPLSSVRRLCYGSRVPRPELHWQYWVWLVALNIRPGKSSSCGHPSVEVRLHNVHKVFESDRVNRCTVGRLIFKCSADSCSGFNARAPCLAMRGCTECCTHFCSNGSSPSLQADRGGRASARA